MKAKKRVDSLTLDVDSGDTSESQNNHIFFCRGTEVFEKVRFSCASFTCKKNVSVTVFEQVDDFSFFFI